MLTFIALFLPPFISMVLTEKHTNKRWSNYSRVTYYIVYVIIVNLCNIFIDMCLGSSVETVTLKITQYNSFAFKYIVMSMIIAIIIPYIHTYIHTYFVDRLNKLHFPKIKVDFDFVGCKRKTEKICLDWVLYVLVACGLIYNFSRIFENNMWGDECWSIMLAQDSLNGMLEMTANDVHPPLYYIFVMILYKVLGSHAWVYHLSAFIAYGITIFFILTSIKRKFGKLVATLMIVFVSFMSACIEYNVEVRMYSWAFLFVLLSYYYLYCIMEKDKWSSWSKFVLMSLAAAYTHYYGLFSVAVLYASLIILVLLKRVKFSRVLIIYIVTILGYLPWLFTLMTTFRRTADNFWITEHLSFQNGLLYFYNSGSHAYSVIMLQITIISVLFLVIRELRIIYFAKSEEICNVHITWPSLGNVRNMNIWLMIGLGTSIGTLLIGELITELIRPALLPRYLYPAFGVMWLTMCVAISQFKHIRKFCAGAILVATLTVCSPWCLQLWEYDVNQDIKCAQTVECMESMIEDDDLLVTTEWQFAWTIFDYYFPKNNYEYINLEYVIPQDKKCWLVMSREAGSAEETWAYNQGYDLTPVCKDGVLGTNPAFVYSIDKMK